MGVNRLAQFGLAVGVAATLTWGSAASVAVARPVALVAPAGPTAAGGDPLAAWAVTATQSGPSSVLALDSATHTAYLGSLDGLSLLNESTGQVTGSITLPGQPEAAAVDLATGVLYVIVGQSVVVIDTQSNKVTTTISETMSPGRIAVDPATDQIYVLNTSTVSVIDGSSDTVTGTIDVGTSLLGIAVDPVTNKLYVTSGNGHAVSVIDGRTDTVTKTITDDAFPNGITVDPATDTIYVANGADGTISVIDGRRNFVTTTVDVDADRGIAADPQTDTIYTLGFSGGLEAINGHTNEFVASLSTSDDPGHTVGSELSIDPAAGIIYVIDDFQSDGDPDTSGLAIITSCASQVVAPAGSNCAKMAAAFEPSAVSFASPSVGVAMGTTDCGPPECFQIAMMVTTDGGKQWSFLNAPPNLEIGPFLPPGDGLLFTSPDDGYLFGSWHTGNGGATWQVTSPEMAPEVLAIGATPTTVYEAAQPNQGRGELLASPIGAARWTKVPGITGHATGFAVSGHSVWVTSATHLWTTTDGRNWQRLGARCPETGYRLAGVAAASASRVAFLCARSAGTGQTASKEVLLSSNGGRTVHLAGPAPALGIPQGFASPPGDPSVLTIAAGGTGSDRKYWLYRSANGGKTWTTVTISSDPKFSFRSLTYTTRTSGWIVLGNGFPSADNTLLHTTDAGRTWHKATT
jgi:YVTN family beta-propeller protein